MQHARQNEDRTPPVALTRALERSLGAVTESLQASTAFILIGDDERCRQHVILDMEPDALTTLEENCYKGAKAADFFEITNTHPTWPEQLTALQAIAGVPLRTESRPYIGALFVAYASPYALSGGEKRLLQHFAGMILDQIDLHRDLPEVPKRASGATHLETAIENCPTALVVTDAEGRVTTWNRATETITGYTADEVIGRYSPMTYPQPDKLATLAEALAERGVVERFILPIRDKAGKLAVHGVSAALLFDDEGQVAGSISVAGDITEIKRVEHELKLFRAALVHSQDGVALVKMPTESQRSPIITFVNQSFCSITGYAEEELLGSGITIFTDGGINKDALDQIESAIHTGQALGIETKTRRKDGSSVWTDLHFTPIVEDHGSAPTYYAVFQRDISERRNLHEAVAHSEARFRSLVQNINEVFTLVDQHGVIQYQSPSVTNAIGYTPEEMLGTDMFDYIHPEDLPYFSDIVGRLLSRDYQTTSVVTVRVHTKEGGWIWGQGIISDLRHDPHVEAMVLNWRDISEFRQLQQQLVMSERLASVGTLAAGVAHEINNPLTYILSNIEYTLQEGERIIQGAYDPQVVADIQGALTEARDGAHRVRNIVRDLGAFSRPEDDTSEPLDAHRILRNTLNLARNEIRHKATVHEDFEEVPAVFANESRLGQVFLNLLVNAAQALPEDRAMDENSIHLSIRPGSDGMVKISISDTGNGIPQDVQARIFDPFFTTKPVGKGTGLGLSICHGFIEAMGGSLDMESKEGAGSTFTISLPPAAGPMQSRPAPPNVPLPRPAHQRVLIIDDEPMIRQAVERLLEGSFDLTMTSDGSEALEQLRDNPDFEAILCDLLMPNMTGMELYERVQRVDPDMAARFIFITGGAFTEGAREFIDTVTNPVLVKPFTKRELINAITRVNRS